jgi:hypothetical protein
MPDIPVTADDLPHDFDTAATPAPGASTHRGLVQHVDPEAADPGHLATEDEWAAIVAHAEGGQP